MFVSFAKNPIGLLPCIITFCWIWISFSPLLFYTSASCGCSKKCSEHDDDSCLRSSDNDSCSCNFKDLFRKVCLFNSNFELLNMQIRFNFFPLLLRFRRVPTNIQKRLRRSVNWNVDQRR